MGNKIQVGVGDYKVSIEPSEYLVTEGLDSCVGLALVGHKGTTQKRGLAHRFYDGSFKEGEFAKLKNNDKERIEKMVKGMISDWEGYENINAYIVANRFKLGMINEKDRPDYVNPAFDYVTSIVETSEAKPKLEDSVIQWRNEARGDSDRKLYHIHWKDISLLKDKINVIYKDDNDKWLNSSNYSYSLY